MGLDLTAIQVLRHTLQAYGTCRTYRDCGRVQVQPAGHAGSQRELFFTTDFVRPSLFRFDVGALASGDEPADSSALDVATVLWDGTCVRVFRAQFAGEAEVPSIGDALSWAARLDGPAADYLVHLLMGRDFDHAEETHVRCLGNEAVEGTPCHKLELPSASGHRRYVLWIDSETHLLRALHEHREHRVGGSWGGGSPAETTFEFYPALDVPIEPGVFACGERPEPRQRLARFLELP